MSGYIWIGIPLLVLGDPRPTLTAGGRWVVSRPPGGQGIGARIPDGRPETRFSCVLGVLNRADVLLLRAAFARHADGDLEIPHGDDALVYAETFVESPPVWEFVAHDRFWRCRVEFICPDPVPRLKSTGEPAY